MAQQLSKGQLLRQLTTDQSVQSVRLVALWQIAALILTLLLAVSRLEAACIEAAHGAAWEGFRQPGSATSCAGCHAVLKQKLFHSVGVPEPARSQSQSNGSSHVLAVECYIHLLAAWLSRVCPCACSKCHGGASPAASARAASWAWGPPTGTISGRRASWCMARCAPSDRREL